MCVCVNIYHTHTSDIVHSQMILFTIATNFCVISRTTYKLLWKLLKVWLAILNTSHFCKAKAQRFFSLLTNPEFFFFFFFLPANNQWREKAMAPHSSTVAWKIPWMEEPGRLQSMGSLRVRHDWATSLWLFTFMHWRRKWQPPPVFLPGESHGWRSLVGCSPWGHRELDTTEST